VSRHTILQWQSVKVLWCLLVLLLLLSLKKLSKLCVIPGLLLLLSLRLTGCLI